jgi:hypothetical protein
MLQSSMVTGPAFVHNLAGTIGVGGMATLGRVTNGYPPANLQCYVALPTYDLKSP